MTKQQFHTRAHYYLALAVAFCLPLGRLVPIFIALLLLNWLVEGDFKNKLESIIKNKFALLFIAFYGMHLIGMLYTKNIAAGWFDMQVKFSLLVFPLIFATRPINSEKIKFVFAAFVVGGAVASLILLTRALYLYFSSNENHFFYQSFSILLHPSYFAMYLDFSITWLLFSIAQSPLSFGEGSGVRSKNSGGPGVRSKNSGWSGVRSKNSGWLGVRSKNSGGLGVRSKNVGEISGIRVGIFLVVLFFSFIIVLLSSKMGLMLLILVFVGFLSNFIFTQKKYGIGMVALVALFISIFSIIRFIPQVGNRIHRAMEVVASSTSDQTDAESTAVRLLIWKAANHVIAENFMLGTGTGDSKEELLKEYQKKGMTGAIAHKLNAHNEFYQVMVGVGLVGFVLLVLNLFLPLQFAFKHANTMYALFLLLIIFNYTVESMLETQAGVMFYAFFNAVLCFSRLESPKLKSPTFKVESSYF